jgi:hypothetical protein
MARPNTFFRSVLGLRCRLRHEQPPPAQMRVVNDPLSAAGGRLEQVRLPLPSCGTGRRLGGLLDGCLKVDAFLQHLGHPAAEAEAGHPMACEGLQGVPCPDASPVKSPDHLQERLDHGAVILAGLIGQVGSDGKLTLKAAPQVLEVSNAGRVVQDDEHGHH